MEKRTFGGGGPHIIRLVKKFVVFYDTRIFGVPRIFFALKNPTASAGFEPANLGTKGQHATPGTKCQRDLVVIHLTNKITERCRY